MRIQILLCFCFAHWSLAAFADEACPSRFSSAQDVISCAEVRSPDVQRALLELNLAKARVGAASQWKNPELSGDSFQGKVGGQNSSETEIGLGVPVELGGKISARKAVAEGGVAQTEAALYDVRSKARAATMLKLHRARQLYHEQEVIDESVATFAKLISQYAKRPKLSPEQELSVAVFRMAKSENDLRKSELQDELTALDSFFRISIGAGLESIKAVLPPSPKSWPKIDGAGKAGASPQFQLLEADLKTAQAELSLAKSESWPTVVLGPSVKIQSGGGNSDQIYGVNLSLPLPLFNMNGAGRTAAAAGVKLFEARRDLGSMELERRREELLMSYRQSIAVLDSTLSHQEIEKKHSDAEKLFLRGIVPSSLVIEAHRSFVELERSRNERELKALESILSIYSLDGKQLEMSL